MKKRLLSLLLLPLALTSCNGAGVSLKMMREKVSTVSDETLYPYYKVVGSIDFNGILMEVDANFDQEPGNNTFVPYSRYNDGFYNANLDTSEKIDDIIIYSMASKSYWLRAPLRINKSNFYSEVYTISDFYINDELGTINPDTYVIGSVAFKNSEGDYINYQNAKITSATAQALNISAEHVTGQDDDKKDIVENVNLTFNREGEADQDFLYAGKFVDENNNSVRIRKGVRENKTCAHYLIEHIITSYAGQTGSTNPSKNKMIMSYSDEGFIFSAEATHTNILIDNFPYYPDPSEHPEIGEWDPEYPIPCYKNKINAKVNIKLTYNSEGWLVKEELSSLNYDHNAASASQVALVAVYGYRFH